MSGMSGGLPAPSELPEVAWVVALASLPGVSVSQIRRIVEQRAGAEAFARARAGDPLVAVEPEEVADGDPSEGDDLDEPRRPALTEVPVLFEVPERLPSRQVRDERRARAESLDVAAYWAAHRAAGIGCALLGEPGYPTAVAADREAPGLLCWRGDLDALHQPRVGMVGTRRCTAYGRDVARRMAQELATAGVSVVSGLAWGIDGAAHEGALRAHGGAPPVAVVGSGIDHVYPRRHRRLWDAVVAAGVVLSEWPMGVRPAPWRFPARNRIIAGLSPVLVVVESHARGGSLTTVDAASRRGTTVMAVPGPVTSPASAGTNDLLADGAGVARGAADVLVASGLCTPERGAATSPAAPVTLPPGAADLLHALTSGPATIDDVVGRTGRPLEGVAVDLAWLARSGLVSCSGGWWEARS